MRRLTMALITAALLAVPAASATAQPQQREDREAAQRVYAAADRMRAAGWHVTHIEVAKSHKDNIRSTTSQQSTTALDAPTPSTYHIDGRIEANTDRWYNTANGRYYYIWGTAAINHSVDEGNVWNGYLDMFCYRQYGTAKAINPCDWHAAYFQVMGFSSASDTTPTVYGSSDVPNHTCYENAVGGTSAWRYVGDDTANPYKMSFISLVYVDFRDANCTTTWHTSVPRVFGSYMAKLTGTESEATNPDRTGWKPWPVPS